MNGQKTRFGQHRRYGLSTKCFFYFEKLLWFFQKHRKSLSDILFETFSCLIKGYLCFIAIISAILKFLHSYAWTKFLQHLRFLRSLLIAFGSHVFIRVNFFLSNYLKTCLPLATVMHFRAPQNQHGFTTDKSPVSTELLASTGLKFKRLEYR